MRPMRPVAGEDAHAACGNPASVGYVRSLKSAPSAVVSAPLPERVEEIEEVQHVDQSVAVDVGFAVGAAR